MANPNDIAKALNEMVRTLEQLSDVELESVKSILEKQKEVISNNKRLEQSKKDLERLKKKEALKEKTLRKEDSKTLKSRLSLVSLIEGTNRKLSEKKSKKSGVGLSLGFMKKVIENERKQFSLFAAQSQIQVKQSSENFDEKKIDVVPELEIKLLRDIDSKIDNITSTKSGGLFDFIMGSVKSLIAAVIPEASGLLGGIAGGGLLGGLGKVLKGGGKGAGKVGEEAAENSGSILKVLSKLKNPKVAIAAGVLATGAGIYSSMSSDDDSGDTLQTRASGGKVARNSVYLVGENGPELFSPQQNGFIVPNHKLKSNSGEGSLDFDFDSFQSTFVNTFKKLLGKVSDGYTEVNKTFSDKIKTIYDDIKSWVMDKINVAGNAVKSVVDDVTKAVGNIVKPLGTATPKVESQPPPKPSFMSSSESVQKFTVPNVPLNLPTASDNIPQMNVPVQDDFSSLIQKLPDVSDMSVQNVYNVPEAPQIQNDGLDMEFWNNDFVKAFSESIKIKDNFNKTKKNIISPVYLQ